MNASPRVVHLRLRAGGRVRVAVAMAGAALALTACTATNEQQTTIPFDPADGRSAQIGGTDANSGIQLRNFLVVSTAQGAPGRVVGAISNRTGQQAQVQLAVVTTSSDGQRQTVGQTSVTVAPGAFVQIGSAAAGSARASASGAAGASSTSSATSGAAAGGGTATSGSSGSSGSSGGSGSSPAPTPSAVGGGGGEAPGVSSAPVGAETTGAPTPAASTAASDNQGAPAAGLTADWVLSAVPVPPGAVVQMLANTSSLGGTSLDVPVLPAVGYYQSLAPSASPSAVPSTVTPTGSLSPSANPSGAGRQQPNPSSSATGAPGANPSGQVGTPSSS